MKPIELLDVTVCRHCHCKTKTEKWYCSYNRELDATEFCTSIDYESCPCKQKDDEARKEREESRLRRRTCDICGADVQGKKALHLMEAHPEYEFEKLTSDSRFIQTTYRCKLCGAHRGIGLMIKHFQQEHPERL